jgi:hypothetical protein
MAKQIHVALYQDTSNGKWKVFTDGEFTEHRIASNFLECKRNAGWCGPLAVVSGTIVPAATPSEIDVILGAF